MINVLTFKQKMIPKLHGTTLAKVGTMYPELQEAAATMLLRIDPPDTIQRSRINNAIYNNVYNYTSPSDLKGVDRILDIRPIGKRSKWDSNAISSIREFDTKKYKDSVVVETIAGVKTLRISKDVGNPATSLSTLSTLSDVDTTIAYSGDITSPVTDSLDYIDFGGSISFGLSGVTGQGILTVTLGTAVNLSTLLNLGSLFHWLKFPNASRFTNMTFRYGQGASNYFQNVITVPQGRTGIDSNAWDLMNAQWASATQVGSPTAYLTWFQFVINYSVGTALTFVKLNSLTASLGQAEEILYYSNAIFQDASTGVLKSTPTADTDIITLDPGALNILLYEVERVLIQQIKGKNMTADLQKIQIDLEGDGRIIRNNLVMNRLGLYRDYIAQNPSQAIPPQEVYHEFDDINGY